MKVQVVLQLSRQEEESLYQVAAAAGLESISSSIWSRSCTHLNLSPASHLFLMAPPLFSEPNGSQAAQYQSYLGQLESS